jgi:hypothetical protein
MVIIKNGEKLQFANIQGSFKGLPKGNYMLKFDPREGYYLIEKENFKLPSKVYGDYSIVDRWLKSYKHNSEKNMGIILSGYKGSGKTITAQKFCIDSELPVIIINDAFEGPDFVDFISNPLLGQSIIFIDEFEKVYSRDTNQSDLLSLMDGNFPTKLIFLLTVNEFSINEYLINRLNRVKYRKDYLDLGDDIVNEVIDDLLINKDHRESVFDFFAKVNMCTFDLLVNLIKEMNLFGEDAIECGKHLNLKSEYKYYEVFEIINGNEYPCVGAHTSPAASIFEIERRDVKYVPKPTKSNDIIYEDDDTEEDDEIMEENTYIPTYFEWNRDEVEIKKMSTNVFYLTHKETGLTFKFKSASSSSMVF